MTTPVPLPPEADPVLGPILSALVGCVCFQLAEIGRPTCACCLVWGDVPPPADYCDCDCDGGHGQAWVRLVRLDERTDGAPVRSSISGRGACHTPVRWRAVVEAGVYRCIHATDEDGTGPTCQEREEDAWGLLADLRALRIAFTCCEALAKRAPLEPLTAQPSSNLGGCGGAYVQFAINL